MSYILDSLKKSDQERKRGSVPDVLSDHGGGGPEPGRPRRRRWPYLVGGGVLLLNGAALAVWLSSAQPEAPVAEERVAAGSSAAAKAQAVRLAGAPEAPPASVPAPAAGSASPSSASRKGRPPGFSSPDAGREQGKRLPARIGGVKPQDRNGWQAREDGKAGRHGLESTAPGPAAARPPVGEAGGTAGASSIPSGEERSIQVDPEPQAGGETPAMPGETPAIPEEASPVPEEATIPPDEGPLAPEDSPPAEAIPDTASPADETGAPGEEPSPAAGPEAGEEPGRPAAPPAVNKLPPSARSGLPEIHISAHFYSKKPESRLVSVNGRILREGQEMDGLKVEEITPSGVIFVHRGRKFFMDVFREGG